MLLVKFYQQGKCCPFVRDQTIVCSPCLPGHEEVYCVAECCRENSTAKSKGTYPWRDQLRQVSDLLAVQRKAEAVLGRGKRRRRYDEMTVIVIDLP